MAPKSIMYQANSILYFAGDQSDKVFILKNGAVLLTAESLETGKDVKSLVQIGEFFGAQSSLGNYPRDETAMTLKESELIVFTVPELENFLMSNSRVNFKMLNVFSQQLRKIHNQLQKLVTDDVSTDPEYGLFQIGEYYLKNRLFKQAEAALKRYLTYYPAGRYTDEAAKKIQMAEQSVSMQPPPRPVIHAAVSSNGEPVEVNVSIAHDGTSGKYLEGLKLFNKKNYQEALAIFTQVIQEKTDPQNEVNAELDLGRTFLELAMYKESVSQLTSFIKKYPRHPDMKNALYYIGMTYDRSGNTDKAITYYKKVKTMMTQSDKLYSALDKALAKAKEK